MAVVQGNFSTGKIVFHNRVLTVPLPNDLFIFIVACPPQNLGIREKVDVSLSSGSFSIPGGLVSYNGTTEKAVATYRCDSGYSLSGNSERVCQSDGNWNGHIPQCTIGEYLIQTVYIVRICFLY